MRAPHWIACDVEEAKAEARANGNANAKQTHRERERNDAALGPDDEGRQTRDTARESQSFSSESERESERARESERRNTKQSKVSRAFGRPANQDEESPAAHLKARRNPHQDPSSSDGRGAAAAGGQQAKELIDRNQEARL